MDERLRNINNSSSVFFTHHSVSLNFVSRDGLAAQCTSSNSRHQRDTRFQIWFNQRLT